MALPAHAVTLDFDVTLRQGKEHPAQSLRAFPTSMFVPGKLQPFPWASQTIHVGQILHCGENSTVYLGTCQDGTELALKFTPAGGQVDIRLESLGADAQITVTDTGIGIAPEFLPYVFDRFSQAEVPSRHSPGGVGIGLAIARHLVELHHGTIEVASAGEGQGATFTVKVPLATSAELNNNTQEGEQ